MDDPVLALESRRRLYHHVRRNPGQFLRELQREMGWGMGALEHHLDALVQEGLVTVLQEGQKRFFPIEVPPPDRVVLGFLRQAIPRHILLALTEGPQARGALVDRLGLAGSTIQYHLQRLEASGVVVARRQGRDVQYGLSKRDDVARLLVWHRASFLDRLVDAFVEGAEGMHRPPPPGERRP